jgi:hypothetical protein
MSLSDPTQEAVAAWTAIAAKLSEHLFNKEDEEGLLMVNALLLGTAHMMEAVHARGATSVLLSKVKDMKC